MILDLFTNLIYICINKFTEINGGIDLIELTIFEMRDRLTGICINCRWFIYHLHIYSLFALNELNRGVGPLQLVASRI